MATTSGTKQFWNLEHSDAFLYCYWKHMAHVQPNLKFGNGIPRRRHIGRDSVDRQAQAERSWYVRFIGNESTRSLAGYFGASSRGTAAQGGGEGFRGGFAKFGHGFKLPLHGTREVLFKCGKDKLAY